MTAPHTSRARALIANLTRNQWSPAQRQNIVAELDAELAALGKIEHGYAELIADAAEQQLLAEPAAGRA